MHSTYGGAGAPPCIFTVPDDCDGMRLDAALSCALPDAGLRARRRLWAWCRICVNGKCSPPGYRVGKGDSIEIIPAEGKPGDENALPKALPPETAAARSAPFDVGSGHGAWSGGHFVSFALAALSREYAAFLKPAGLHTAHIAGGAEQSLEGLLPSVWPRLLAGHGRESGGYGVDPGPAEPPILLTRLDKATSGLVLAARNRDALANFRTWEQAGQIEKTYVGLVRGHVSGRLLLRNRLLTAARPVTRVLGEADPDETRHTDAEALQALHLPRPWPEGTAATLLRAIIRRGARHQIRAHLAHAGYPLLGEHLYAPPPPIPCPLYLHHTMIRFPGFSARALPGDWSPIFSQYAVLGAL